MPDHVHDATSPLRMVIRSKGFLWLNSKHHNCFYWSHAGASFKIRVAGSWWSVLPSEQWPDGDFPKELQEDIGDEYGDCRQEIVFIGVKMDEAAIRKKLDGALLNDEEFEAFRQRYKAGDWRKIIQEKYGVKVQN